MDERILDAPRLWLGAEMTEPERYAFAGGTVVVISIRSPLGTSVNEDGAAAVPLHNGGGVLAVADGFGGRPGGERACRAALDQLRLSVAETGDGGVTRDAIVTGFERANEAVLGSGIGAATTLVAAELVGNTIRTYNVGDSMLLVVGQRGKVKLRTLPHSPVGYAVESGLLDEAEAMHHEDRHYVSNMVGSPDMRIELTTTMELSDFDTVILGTDGLWDNLHVEEVIEAVRKGPLDEVARTLAGACSNRMRTRDEGAPSKPDDCTFMLFRQQ